VRVKLDENLPQSAREVVIEAGHEVDTVAEEGLTGAPDPDVVRAATEAGRLLISLDRGLGDIPRYPPGGHAGVLVLRVSDQSAASVRSALTAVLASHDLETLSGANAVAQRGLLRVRRPQ
jgi:predicted nuclease of predicted toxin-antitoxin system